MEVDAFNVFLNKGVEGGGFADRLAFAKENAGLRRRSGSSKIPGGAGRPGPRGRRRPQLAQAERASKSSDLTVVRKQALARLVREERIDTNATGVEDFLNKGASFGLIGDAEQKRIDDEVQHTLDARSPGGVGEARVRRPLQPHARGPREGTQPAARRASEEGHEPAGRRGRRGERHRAQRRVALQRRGGPVRQPQRPVHGEAEPRPPVARRRARRPRARGGRLARDRRRLPGPGGRGRTWGRQRRRGERDQQPDEGAGQGDGPAVSPAQAAREPRPRERR